MIHNITIYRCPNCDSLGRDSSFCRDDIGGLYCGDCGEEVVPHEERMPNWVSVALYTVDRAYGGPEEGGWWYDTGCRQIETIRCFGRGDFPQVEEYKNLLQRRSVNGEYQSRTLVRIYAEELAPEFWPTRRPIYS